MHARQHLQGPNHIPAFAMTVNLCKIHSRPRKPGV